MRTDASWRGAAEVFKRLRDLVPEAAENLAAVKLEAVKDLAEKIRPRAPGSGKYRASIQGDRLDARPAGRYRQTRRSAADPDAVGLFADWTWRFAEFGTRPHIIRAKPGRPLKFRGRGGTIVSAKTINHPGGKARPHIFPTYRAARASIRRRMANAVNKAVRKARRK